MVQSHDEQDRRGSSAEEKVKRDASAEAKTHTAEDVRKLWRKRMRVNRNRPRVLNTAHVIEILRIIDEKEPE